MFGILSVEATLAHRTRDRRGKKKDECYASKITTYTAKKKGTCREGRENKNNS